MQTLLVEEPEPVRMQISEFRMGCNQQKPKIRKPLKLLPHEEQKDRTRKAQETLTRKVDIQVTQIEEECEPLVESQFEKLQVIGKGSFGRVHKVRSSRGRTNGKQFAMKVMAKNRCTEIKSVKNELNLLKNLKSDFVINMHYAFQDEENLYLVMDLMEGGDLHF